MAELWFGQAATVNYEFRTSDKRSFVRQKKKTSVGDILGLTDSS
jgi:hypothetical protein